MPETKAIADAQSSSGFDMVPYSSKDRDDVSTSSFGKKPREEGSRCSIGKMTPGDEAIPRGKMEQGVTVKR